MAGMLETLKERNAELLIGITLKSYGSFTLIDTDNVNSMDFKNGFDALSLSSRIQECSRYSY